MALTTYNPDANKIVHTTGVDFNSRPSIFKPVHIVQYDNRTPILAVSMYNDGVEYAAPGTASANIRLRKRDGTVVSNPALGCSSDRKIVYFEITIQMVAEYGPTKPIVELYIGENVAGSSAINMIVDKNPIQEGDVESTDEFKSLDSYVNDAKASASAAKTSENNAKTSENNAKTHADNAKRSEEVAVASKNAAAESQDEALKSANAAKASQTAAADSEAKAAQRETNAAASATAASTSESNAKDWADWANSYARGEGNKRENEKTDNSKYYYEQILKLEQAKNGIIPMGSITFEELANADKQVGYMYNVTDAFTTDDTFSVGPGHYFGPGNNILWTAQEQWDVMAASTVTGIKGNNEDAYQQGDYEITPDKVRLNDNFATAIERAKLAPGDSLSTAFSKLAKYCETIESNEKKTPIFGKYEEFPRPGDTGRLYVDDTVDPRLIFTWDEAQSEYVLTGGAGGEGSSVDIPLTLSHSAWVGSAAPYSQTLTVPQMREGMTPVHFVDSLATDEELYAYSLLIDYTAGLGSITFYATEIPAIDIHLVLKGVPAQELDYANNNVIVLVDADGFELGDSNMYEKTIAVEGMKAGIGGYWDLIRSGGVITREESAIALNILNVERLDGAVKVTCLKQPTKDFQLLLFETYKEATEGDTLISNFKEVVDQVSTNAANITGLTSSVGSLQTAVSTNSTNIGNLNTTLSGIEEDLETRTGEFNNQYTEYYKNSIISEFDKQPNGNYFGNFISYSADVGGIVSNIYMKHTSGDYGAVISFSYDNMRVGYRPTFMLKSYGNWYGPYFI